MPDLCGVTKPDDFREFLASPRVVATVHRAEDLVSLAARPHDPAPADLLEFRLDNLRGHLEAALKAMAASSLPVLITARHPAEGGAGDLDVGSRRDLLLRALPHATLVDLEVRSLSDLSAVRDAAHERGVGVVASYHDFETMPPMADLEAALAAATEGLADVTKLALRLDAMRDLAPLALLTESTAREGRLISTMGMGPLGKVSRLVLAAAGSCLNYGYLHEPNAPGQWPAGELKRLIGEIGKGG